MFLAIGNAYVWYSINMNLLNVVKNLVWTEYICLTKFVIFDRVDHFKPGDETNCSVAVSFMAGLEDHLVSQTTGKGERKHSTVPRCAFMRKEHLLLRHTWLEKWSVFSNEKRFWGLTTEFWFTANTKLSWGS